MEPNNYLPGNYLPDHLYTSLHAHTTLTRQKLKDTLEATGGKVVAAGRLRIIRSKHIGVGMYDVWLEVNNG